MANFLLSYDIKKQDRITRKLSPEEIKSIHRARVEVRDELMTRLTPIVSTTYLIENCNDNNIDDIGRMIIALFHAIIEKTKNIHLLGIYEIKVLIIDLKSGSKVMFPSGEIKILT